MTTETQKPPASVLSSAEKQQALEQRYRERGSFVSGDSFQPSSTAFSISLDGLEGTGKTQFIMLTMPRPLVVINFGDRSPLQFFYRMTEEQRKGVKVFDLQANSSEGFTLAAARNALKEMTEIIDTYARDMQGGTFAIDGGSSWWSVMQQVFVEPKQQARAAAGEKQLGGIVYEEANGRVRGVLGYLKSQGVFLALTHQMKQDWDERGPIPGRFSPRKNSQVPGLMEVQLTLFKKCAVCNAPDCQNDQHVGRKHMAKITKLSGNTSLEGLIMENVDFPTVYKLQTGKEWKR